MRYYSFAITDGVSDILRIYGGFKENRCDCVGVNLAFETQVFSQNFSQTIGYVRLDNAFSLDDYQKILSYKGKIMELYAGFSEGAPYLKLLDYPSVKNMLVIRGKIQNVVGDFSSKTKSVYFYFVPQYNINKSYNILNQNKKFYCVLNKGDKVADKIKRMLKGIVDTQNRQESLSIICSEWVDNLEWKYNAFTIEESSFASFWSKLSELSFIENNTIYHIDSYINTKGSLVLKRNDEVIQDNNVVIIYPQEIISQPNIIDLYGKLSVTIRLRADLNMNTIIELSKAKIKTTGVASNSAQGMSLNYPMLYAETLYSKKYRITSINHIGEYCNPSNESWSTQLELYPL